MLAGKPADPDSERRAWIAVAALRLRLLYAAIGYGVYSAASEGGAAAAREWHDWLEWVEEFVAKLEQETPAVRLHADPPGWLQQVIELIDGFERSDAGSLGDAFADEAVRRWATLEFEHLAELARPIERMAAEPPGEIEDRGSAAGMALLGAVQDSLVLAVSEDDRVRAMRAGSAEIYESLVAAREEGVWDVLAGA